MATEQYTISTAFDDSQVDIASLHGEIDEDVNITTALVGITTASNICYIEFAAALSQAEKTALDSIIAAHSYLNRAKSIKFGAIDDKTSALIGAGFTFSSKQFSLSVEAQCRIIGIHQVRDDAAVTYPIKWNTKSDNDYLELADSATVHNFYLTALGTYRAHVDSGTTLKDEVRAATTVTAVDAIVDNR